MFARTTKGICKHYSSSDYRFTCIRKKKNSFKYVSVYKTMVWLSSLPISRLSDRWMPDSCQFLGMWEKMLSAARVAGCSPIFVHNFGSLLSVKKQATLFIPPFVASVQEEKALLATVSARVTYKRYKNAFFFLSLAATSLLQSRQKEHSIAKLIFTTI